MKHAQYLPVEYFTRFKTSDTNPTLRGRHNDVVIAATSDHADLVPGLRHGHRQRSITHIPYFQHTVI